MSGAAGSKEDLVSRAIAAGASLPAPLRREIQIRNDGYPVLDSSSGCKRRTQQSIIHKRRIAEDVVADECLSESTWAVVTRQKGSRDAARISVKIEGKRCDGALQLRG